MKMIIVVSVLVAGVIVFLGVNTFRLRRLIIISPIVDTRISNAFDQQYTFLIKRSQVENIILQNPIWQDAQVHIVNPYTAHVRVTAKKPIAVVELRKSLIPIAFDGTPLANNAVKGLPTIVASSLTDYIAGSSDWRVTKAVDMIVKLSNVGLEASKVTIEQKNSLYIIMISKGPEVVVSQTFSPSELAASLQIIISRFKIEGKTVTKIDFQYDKPVIILSSQTKGAMQ